MVAPFPAFATAGGTAPTNIAQEIFGHYVWMARWSEEIVNDVDLDMKKIAQLAFVHCRLFDALISPPVPDDVATAVVSRFAADGLEWPTLADLKADMAALKSEAATLFNWVSANVSGTIDIATLQISNTGARTETPIIMSPKPAAVQTRVQALRSLFA